MANKDTVVSIEEMTTRIQDKMVECMQYQAALAKGESIDGEILKESTVKTQKQVRKTQFNVLSMMKALLEHFDASDLACLPDNVKEFMTSYTTLTETRKAVKVEVHKGDKILDLMQKYWTVSNPVQKITEACRKAGLTIDMKAGVIR